MYALELLIAVALPLAPLALGYAAYQAVTCWLGCGSDDLSADVE